MINYKSWLIDDLRALERLRFSIGQMESELQTLEAEYAAIQATDFDKIPGGNGENTQEDRLLTAIARKDALQANLKATRLRVEDLDRLLAALPDDERRTLELMFISREKYAAGRLCEEFNLEMASVYRLKDRALRHLAQLRHGAGVSP